MRHPENHPSGIAAGTPGAVDAANQLCIEIHGVIVRDEPVAGPVKVAAAGVAGGIVSGRRLALFAIRIGAVKSSQMLRHLILCFIGDAMRGPAAFEVQSADESEFDGEVGLIAPFEIAGEPLLLLLYGQQAEVVVGGIDLSDMPGMGEVRPGRIQLPKHFRGDLSVVDQRGNAVFFRDVRRALSNIVRVLIADAVVLIGAVPPDHDRRIVAMAADEPGAALSPLFANAAPRQFAPLHIRHGWNHHHAGFRRVLQKVRFRKVDLTGVKIVCRPDFDQVESILPQGIYRPAHLNCTQQFEAVMKYGRSHIDTLPVEQIISARYFKLPEAESFLNRLRKISGGNRQVETVQPGVRRVPQPGVRPGLGDFRCGVALTVRPEPDDAGGQTFHNGSVRIPDLCADRPLRLLFQPGELQLQGEFTPFHGGLNEYGTEIALDGTAGENHISGQPFAFDPLLEAIGLIRRRPFGNGDIPHIGNAGHPQQEILLFARLQDSRQFQCAVRIPDCADALPVDRYFGNCGEVFHIKKDPAVCPRLRRVHFAMKIGGCQFVERRVAPELPASGNGKPDRFAGSPRARNIDISPAVRERIFRVEFRVRRLKPPQTVEYDFGPVGTGGDDRFLPPVERPACRKRSVQLFAAFSRHIQNPV